MNLNYVSPPVPRMTILTSASGRFSAADHQDRISVLDSTILDVIHEKKEMDEDSVPCIMTKGGVKEPFPVKLWNVLHHIDGKEPHLARAISWSNDGKSFRVHCQRRFEQEVQRRFFKQSRYSSFRRQLNLWGFTRIESKRNKNNGFYFHCKFLRDDKYLCRTMTRIPRPPLKVNASKLTSQGKKTQVPCRSKSLYLSDELCLQTDSYDDEEVFSTSFPSRSHCSTMQSSHYSIQTSQHTVDGFDIDRHSLTDLEPVENIEYDVFDISPKLAFYMLCLLKDLEHRH